MPKIRTVSKSKSDGVKNKTVTYNLGGITATKTKTKKRGVDGKTRVKSKGTTVSDRGRSLATGYKIKQGGRTTDKMKTATGRGGTFVEAETQTTGGAKTKYRRTANSGSMTKTKGGGVKTKDGRKTRSLSLGTGKKRTSSTEGGVKTSRAVGKRRSKSIETQQREPYTTTTTRADKTRTRGKTKTGLNKKTVVKTVDTTGNTVTKKKFTLKPNKPQNKNTSKSKSVSGARADRMYNRMVDKQNRMDAKATRRAVLGRDIPLPKSR